MLRAEQRGQPLDDAAAIQAVQAVGEFAIDHHGLIESLDINPLVVLQNGRGVRLLDALIVLPQSAGDAPKQSRARERVAAVEK